MKEVEIYTKSYCPYCHRAKDFLRARGIAFKEIDVTHDRETERQMRARSSRRTVPQIFIGGLGIGGHDDLIRLDRRGELGQLLAGIATPA